MESRRFSVWLLIVVTALLSAILTLSIDRGITTALQSEPTPIATPTVSLPVQTVIVQLATPVPEPDQPVFDADETRQAIRQLQQQAVHYRGAMFVLKTERQVTFALEALLTNDLARADRELVAARAALDEAFALVPEDLKPQVDTERLEISRVRADLVINPRGLDDDLRRMRDRLLSLISTQPQ